MFGRSVKSLLNELGEMEVWILVKDWTTIWFRDEKLGYSDQVLASNPYMAERLNLVLRKVKARRAEVAEEERIAEICKKVCKTKVKKTKKAKKQEQSDE